MAPHPTQIFLHNPRALRAELRLDDRRLLLWWSPRAGESFDCADRNFSNRDDHLDVFDWVRLPDLDLARFEGCDYDAYRAVLRFAGFTVTLEMAVDAPAVVLSATVPLTIEFKTARYDRTARETPALWVVEHAEPGRDFEFAVAVGSGSGELRTAPMHAPGNARYFWATLAPGQSMAIGVGLRREDVAGAVARLAGQGAAARAATVEQRLAADLRQGTPEFAEARLDRLYAANRRSLHGAIDDSGAIRASLKNIYYLIWLRDGAFCFNYQAAAGWMHRHEEWCRLVLANPLVLDEPDLPRGRAFGQLVNRTYGKMEEDGLYYAVWSVFTHHVQTGSTALLTPDHLALLIGALEWLEAYSFDPERGLFFSRFADESPVRLCRDHGIDAAIGARATERGIAFQGRAIARCYDHYFNGLMHGVYRMLAVLPGLPAARVADCEVKAARLWAQLAPLFPASGLPPYGELLLEDGERVISPAFVPSRSVYVWAFCLPGLAPIPNIDAIRLALLRDVMAKPRLHWLNGIGALVAAVDPLTCDPAELHDAVTRLAAQAERPGKFLPMGGTLPEKFDAPDGSLYDDIRPQAFAQSAWLAAGASLGIRRLPFGLAVRPTAFLRAWRAYAWRESEIDFVFGGEHEGVRIDGEPLRHSLQLPESRLRAGPVTVSVGDRLPAGGAWARSNVTLHDVRLEERAIIFEIDAIGANELVFTLRPREFHVCGPSGTTPVAEWSLESGLWFARFEGKGRFDIRATFPA